MSSNPPEGIPLQDMHPLAPRNQAILPVKKVIVHPLVLASVADDFNRVNRAQGVKRIKRVVGVLLGRVKADKTLDVTNSFAVPFDEDENEWSLDMNYLEAMYKEFFKDDDKQKILGWYHSGPKLCEKDIAINERLKPFMPDPVLIVIPAVPMNLGLPTKAYIEVQEVHGHGTQPIKTFKLITSEIGKERRSKEMLLFGAGICYALASLAMTAAAFFDREDPFEIRFFFGFLIFSGLASIAFLVLFISVYKMK